MTDIKIVKGLCCPECEAFIMENKIPDIETFYICPECEELHVARRYAQACCADLLEPKE